MTESRPSADQSRRWPMWVGLAVVTLGAVVALSLWWRRVADDGQAATPLASGSVPGRSLSAVAPERSEKALRGRVPTFRTEAKELSPHSQALRAKNEARASGAAVPGTLELFEAEARDPVWAPAMEGALAGRFDRAQKLLEAAGIKGVEISQSCRTSTCRMEVEYTQDAVDRIHALGENTNPYGYLIGQTGPFSQSSSDRSHQPIAVVDDVIRYRKVIHLAFGEEDSKPSQYEAWYTETKKRWDEARAKNGDVPRRRGLPPPEER